MNEFKSTPQFEEDIRQSFGVPDIRPEFVFQLRDEIAQKATAKSRKSFQLLKLRPAWAIALAVLAVMILTTLVIGPQKVYAEFMRLFGYVPGVGFVNLDQVRVLQNGVAQQHDGRSLTALRGLIDAHGTDLWLEFSDEARPIDDAWLETSDGQHFDLTGWSYSPDLAGTHGVAAHFAPLPPEVNQVVLALPEGWRIPLTWVPGSQSSLVPVNIVTAPPSATPEVSETTPAGQSATAQPALCSQVMDIQFCLQAAVRTENQLQVLLEATPGGQFVPGSSYSPSLFDVPEELPNLTLTDEDGSLYPVDPKYIQVGGEPSGRTSTLLFPGAQSLTGRLTLNIPAVLVSLPLADQIRVDLGPNPQPGQTLVINQTIDVGGMPVHFSQAELTGDGINTLQLSLTSGPLDTNAQMRPYLIEPGRPEGIQDRYGNGGGPDNLSIHVELIQQSGLRTGVLNIPLVNATIKSARTFRLILRCPIQPGNHHPRTSNYHWRYFRAFARRRTTPDGRFPVHRPRARVWRPAHRHLRWNKFHPSGRFPCFRFHPQGGGRPARTGGCRLSPS